MTQERPGRLAAMVFFVFLLAASAFLRNSVWETKLSLWTDVARKTPGKSRVHNSLGNSYMLLDRNFEAVQEYKKALALDRGNIEVYYNLGMNLEKVGLEAEAVSYYRYFCKAAPVDYPDTTKTACERAEQLSNGPASPGR